MIHRLTFSLLLTLTTLTLFAQSNKVAIPEVVDKEGNVSYAVRLMVRSNLTKAISEKQGYAAYDRVDIGTIMDEHSFQRTGMVDDRTIRKLGEMTGCNLVLIAEVASIDSDNYYVSAKIVEIETARTKQIESTLMGASANSIQKGCDELVSKLLGATRISSANRRAANSTPNKAVVLVTGLRVFPYDIGEFNVAPYQTIQSLNQKKTFGYSNWRLPTRDELSLLRANSASLGDLKNEQYMVSNPASGQVDEISYGGATGWIRLVSDGWTPAEELELKKKIVREIYGVGNDFIIDFSIGLVISPDIKTYYSYYNDHFTAPTGWHIATLDEYRRIYRYLTQKDLLMYAYSFDVKTTYPGRPISWIKDYYADCFYPVNWGTGTFQTGRADKKDEKCYKPNEITDYSPYNYHDGKHVDLYVRYVRPLPDESTISNYLQKYY